MISNYAHLLTLCMIDKEEIILAIILKKIHNDE